MPLAADSRAGQHRQVDDNEGNATALWRRTVETLLSRGASPSEAIEGAHLIMRAYKRQQQQEEQAPDSNVRPGLASGDR